jgi:hypothetical protein
MLESHLCAPSAQDDLAPLIASKVAILKRWIAQGKLTTLPLLAAFQGAQVDELGQGARIGAGRVDVVLRDRAGRRQALHDADPAGPPAESGRS